jgi:serine protein kinase
MNEKLKETLRSANSTARAEDEILSFDEYLGVVKASPWVTRNTMQIMHDMVLSSGVKHSMVPGKPAVHKYEFFEDSALTGNLSVFGQQTAKENLIERFSNASKGKEASKRLWILLGPPGSAKSLSLNCIKNALRKYSASEDGKTYTLLIPTVNEKLKSKAVHTEGKVMYVQAPCFERPLQIVPPHLREEFVAELEEEIDRDSLEAFFEANSHYDNQFRITIEGRLSPAADFIYKEFLKDQGLDFVEGLAHVKVKRMIYDADTKNGIGSYTPRDEKSQESGSLVGNIDYTLLPKFGSESHPLVHDYQGELCVGANGFVEIHEILKLNDKFLYELLFATQDRFFKPEGQPPIPFNGVIIGHTNFHEYNMFLENPAFEALRSRTVFIEMPFSTDFKEEEKIYQASYSNAKRKWSKDMKHTAHTAPHSLELLSLTAVMSRLHDSKQNKNLTLLQKALIYAGRTDSGVDNNMARTTIDEFKFIKPAEGTFGIDPRFVQNIFESTEHFQINEFLANMDKLDSEDCDETMLGSISLKNPCVTPLDLYLRMESLIKEAYAHNKNKLDLYVSRILPQAKQWIYSEIANDVYSAILRDDSVIESTWKKYTDHVKAYAHNTMVKHEVTHADVKPDEKFMQSIEQYIGVPDKESFRKELSDAISSIGHKLLLRDEPTYQTAIKKYVFQNEFKSGENMKLLGWIKSGLSSADVNSKEHEELNETVRYLIEKKGYCGKCAHQALVITANASSIN